MSYWFILVAMIFCHIVDDYYLQGWLASAKQKKWWQEHAPDALYKYDYIIALIMHSISWSFMIMLPWAIFLGFAPSVSYFVLLVINVIVHAFVDDLKANKLKINLIIDQLIHMIQIVITAIIMMIWHDTMIA